MPTLYVVETGARVEKEHHCLLVTREDEVLCRVPLRSVSQLVLVGPVGVTTPALYALLGAHVPVTLIARSGRLVGRLLPRAGPDVALRRAQYRRNDDGAFCLRLARAIVAGKLRNQRVVALRILRRRPGADRSALAALYAAEESVATATSREVLLGVEGAGAAAYLRIYRQAFAAQWHFGRRTRRPPRDAINALLSLGYTLLTHSLMAALEVAGLDPHLGYLHTEARGRPALALDLLEEFRAPFVDSLVMSMANRRLLQPDDLARRGPTFVLGAAGLRLVLREFGERLESAIRLPGVGRPLSYRKVLERQAHRLARVIRGEVPEYRPFRAR